MVAAATHGACLPRMQPPQTSAYNAAQLLCGIAVETGFMALLYTLRSTETYKHDRFLLVEQNQLFRAQIQGMKDPEAQQGET